MTFLIFCSTIHLNMWKLGENMKQVLAGEGEKQKIFFTQNNTVIGEQLEDGKVLKIKVQTIKSPDGKHQRYYINRGGYIIGWISEDLKRCQGMNRRQQNLLTDIASAMKAVQS